MGKYQSFPGQYFPLGASWNGEGVNFAVYAENANKMELCLFEDENDHEGVRLEFPSKTHSIHHIYVPGLKPGQLYGLRAYGPYDPSNGHRYNSAKLLIDPYARALAGTIRWNNALYGYQIGSEQEDLETNHDDSAPFVPKSVVIDCNFDWEDDRRLRNPYHQTVIYETHVKGFTQRCPHIPEQIRGKYAGLSHPATIDYLKKLGVTAVELLPVHEFVSEHFLIEKGLTNYWGYNTIAFFAPDARYASCDVRGGQVTEFKTMVKELHKAGIEVILDVVYNHTAEGNHLGPTLSLKGIDNACYCRLDKDKRFYYDYTGTGNSLHAQRPCALRMIMDSLRYWITEMHVDGFRFDLASTLARELHEVNQLSAFFHIIYQDPVISQVKLIAEPWDVGEGGYQVGNFPPGWAEWNGEYRDFFRQYWKFGEKKLPEFANRLLGSPDLYESAGRTPSASINFITAHDGFTLRDLVSYEHKHNEDNGSNNTDGNDQNHSTNWGVEGETEDPHIIQNRKRHMRNLLATMFLSQGVPMLLAGDERGHTQWGNNNCYCQDNERTWIDWDNHDPELLEFTCWLVNFRRRHHSFSRHGWFQGQELWGEDVKDIVWFLPDGSEIDPHQREDYQSNCVSVYLNGNGFHYAGASSERILDDSFFIIFNSHWEDVQFTFPESNYGPEWRHIMDTSTARFGNEENSYHAGDTISVPANSISLFFHPVILKDNAEVGDTSE